jgi:sugar/nucleoside kinase (ribokinase family)
LVALDQKQLLKPGSIDTAPLAAIARAVDFAIMAASITCSRRGADLPTRDDVETMMRGSDG